MNVNLAPGLSNPLNLVVQWLLLFHKITLSEIMLELGHVEDAQNHIGTNNLNELQDGEMYFLKKWTVKELLLMLEGIK